MIGKLETAALVPQSASESPISCPNSSLSTRPDGAPTGEPGPLLFPGLIFSLYHTLIATLGSKYSFPSTLTIIVV